MADDLRRQIEDFYYREAELLDDRKLREWLELLADDIRYWMPVRHNPLERPADLSAELARPGEAFYFDDGKESLRIRIERAYARNAWAEMPPSRTRHLITNVRVKADDGREIDARSNFLVYRTRMETGQDLFVGTRDDRLRRIAGGFSIARRTIILDQAVLSAKNISIFL
jgi:3-phenylpropionate/cinnamic acid dioxygenase small subunit